MCIRDSLSLLETREPNLAPPLATPSLRCCFFPLFFLDDFFLIFSVLFFVNSARPPVRSNAPNSCVFRESPLVALSLTSEIFIGLPLLLVNLRYVLRRLDSFLNAFLSSEILSNCESILLILLLIFLTSDPVSYTHLTLPTKA